MRLSEDQKKSIEERIKTIRDNAPNEVKDIWNGTVDWFPSDNPMVPKAALDLLPPKLQRQYLKIIRELRGKK